MNRSDLLLIDPNCLDQYADTLKKLNAVDKAMDLSEETYWTDEWALSGFKPYNVENGILTIPVEGSLFGDLDISFLGMATGYDYIQKAYDRGMSDPDVSEIHLSIKSGGGQVYSLFELVEYMNANKKKPVTSMCLGAACSAAFALATVGDVIAARPSSTLASIGCLMVHVDYSAQLAKEGVNVTIIRHGSRKAEINSMEPLKEESKKELDNSVKKLYDDFVLMVANSRNLDPKIIYGLESRTVTGTEALSLGLIDRIEGYPNKQKDMNQENKNMAIEKSAHDKEHLSQTTNKTELSEAQMMEKIKQATMQAVKAEQSRMNDILTKCSSHPKTAMMLATMTALSAEEIQNVLASFAEEKANLGAEAASNSFEKAMKNGNPDLTLDSEEGQKPSILSEVLSNCKLNKKS